MPEVHEVTSRLPFNILLIEFSAIQRKFPKTILVAYPSQTTITLVGEHEEATEGLCALINIPVHTDDFTSPTDRETCHHIYTEYDNWGRILGRVPPGK